MIVLITGATHTGKTKLAQTILKAYGIPYLSIDHLKMGLIRSGNTSLTPESSQQSLTDYLWPIVREMIKTAIENKQNLTVEGCYVPADWEKDFSSEMRAQIRFICLVMTERYINTHFDDIIRYASVIEQRIDDSYCTRELILQDNAFFHSLCLAHGFTPTLIDQAYHIEVIL
ncbi:MAG: adenylate kinase [Clostridia bacterium]|nr:adenylate kinase [Clostridia bacterium]